MFSRYEQQALRDLIGEREAMNQRNVRLMARVAELEKRLFALENVPKPATQKRKNGGLENAATVS